MSAAERAPVAGAASLAEALARVQASLPAIRKGNVGTVKSEKANYQFRYADLSEISAAVLPALGRVGLAWTALPTLVDGGRFVLAYRLLHAASGESLVGEYPLPDPARTPPQQLGSAISYARKHTLCSVTGVAPADADHPADHPAAGGRPRATSGPPQTAHTAPPRRTHPITATPPGAPAHDDRGHDDRGHSGHPAGEQPAAAPVRMLTEFPPVPPAPGDHPAARGVQSSIARAVAKGGITVDADRYAVVSRLAGRTAAVSSTGELTAAEARQVLTLLSGWDHAGLLAEQLAAIRDAARPPAGGNGEPVLPAPGTAAWHEAGHPTRAVGGPVVTVPVLRSGDCGICEQDDHHAAAGAGS